MGSVEDRYDNALAESAFAKLGELVEQQTDGRFATRREAKLAVFDYLETLSPRRRSSALGQISPPANVEANPAQNSTALHTVGPAA